MGIAIADTVHFLVRYRAERRDGASPEEAALRTTRFVGRPIAITSVMLMLGFGIVAFSRRIPGRLREVFLATARRMPSRLGSDSPE